MNEPKPTKIHSIVDHHPEVIERSTKYRSLDEILGDIRSFLYTDGQRTAYQYDENHGPQISRLSEEQVIYRTRNILSGVTFFLDTNERIVVLSNSTSSIFQKIKEVLTTITQINQLIEEFENASERNCIDGDKLHKTPLNAIVSILNKLTHLNSRIDELQKLILNHDKTPIGDKIVVSDEPSL